MSKKSDKKESKSKASAKAKKIPKALKTSKDYSQKGKQYLDFNHFWAVSAFKDKLKPNWKEALQAHMKKLGYDSPDKYEAGLKHFLGK